MKITNKAERMVYEFGSLKSGELFMDLVHFDESDVFVKLDKTDDWDDVLKKDIDGAAINLRNGNIYEYKNEESVVRIETELVIHKYL